MQNLHFGTSRPRILEILQKRGRASTEELAEHMALSPASVRRHLDVLQRDGTVSFEEVHRPTGRPYYAFFLTEAGRESLGKDYSRLAQWLLQGLVSLSCQDTEGRNGGQVLQIVVHRAALRLANAYAPRMQGKGLGERVKELTVILKEEGFAAEWEATGNGYLIRCFNCPYHRVALLIRQICSLDLYFKSNLLEARTEREKCLVEGDNCCAYRVQL